MGGSSIFPPTDDVPRGAGRREVRYEASWEGGRRDPSLEPPLLFLVGGSYVLGPRRPGWLGGEKGRCWDAYIQSLNSSLPPATSVSPPSARRSIPAIDSIDRIIPNSIPLKNPGLLKKMLAPYITQSSRLLHMVYSRIEQLLTKENSHDDVCSAHKGIEES